MQEDACAGCNFFDKEYLPLWVSSPHLLFTLVGSSWCPEERKDHHTPAAALPGATADQLNGPLLPGIFAACSTQRSLSLSKQSAGANPHRCRGRVCSAVWPVKIIFAVVLVATRRGRPRRRTLCMPAAAWRKNELGYCFSSWRYPQHVSTGHRQCQNFRTGRLETAQQWHELLQKSSFLKLAAVGWRRGKAGPGRPWYGSTASNKLMPI